MDSRDCVWFHGVLPIDVEAMVDVSSQICAFAKVVKLLVIVETQDPWKIQVKLIFFFQIVKGKGGLNLRCFLFGEDETKLKKSFEIIPLLI